MKAAVSIVMEGVTWVTDAWQQEQHAVLVHELQALLVLTSRQLLWSVLASMIQ